MMTSSNGNIFRVTGSLCWEFTNHRWILRTKESDAELWCFLWSAPWINGWVNTREVCDLRRHRAHHDITVMYLLYWCSKHCYWKFISLYTVEMNACMSYFSSLLRKKHWWHFYFSNNIPDTFLHAHSIHVVVTCYVYQKTHTPIFFCYALVSYG